MVVAGAKRTINYQAFDVQITEAAPGVKALVILEPDGVAHVFALAEGGKKIIMEGLAGVVQASPADIERLGKNGQSPTA